MVENMRIYNLRISSAKKFADSHTSEICGFAIADGAQEFADFKNTVH